MSDYTGAVLPQQRGLRPAARRDGVLRDVAPRPLRFLVTGCATARKLERLFAEFPSATVASTKPVMKALRGHATRTGLRHSAAWSTKRELLVERNVARYIAFCEALRPSVPPPAARRWRTEPVIVHRRPPSGSSYS